MIELARPVARKSRLIVHAARNKKVVVALEATDTITIRPIGTRKAKAYSMTFEDFFWSCARARVNAKGAENAAKRKAKRKAKQ